ncbi:MAG: hypothetical protein ACOZE5_18850 [Verrucomicrobiota bacterium]
MKTNTIQIILSALTVGLFAGFASTRITGDFLTGAAVAVGYIAVAALVALAAADYRRQRTYTA